jgi:peptide/nickel transport system permease protein
VSTVLFLLAASVLASLLFRVAPGSDVDSRELNPAYSSASLEAMRQRKLELRDRIGISASYFAGVLRGDLGRSELTGAPVTQLLLERVPGTARLVIFTASISMLAALILAGLAHYGRAAWPKGGLSAVSSSLISIPSGVMVLMAILARLPVEWAAIALVTPRLYGYLTRAAAERLRAPFALNSTALGLSRYRILLRHILPAMLPEIAGVAALAAVTAFAVAVPAEVLSGRPGIGELAWKAALDRDLPVVLGTTLVVALGLRLVTACSSLAAGGRV